jgi:hypothetical protein
MIPTPDQITILFVLKVLSIASYPFVEYYLGKTKKVQANSVLELVLTIASSILKSLSNTNSNGSTGGSSNDQK